MSKYNIDDTKPFQIVFFIEANDTNPNGDPDDDNMPRVDSETGQGLITGVSIKRKVRDFVHLAKNGVPGYGIYVSIDQALNTKHQKALEQATEELKVEMQEQFNVAIEALGDNEDEKKALKKGYEKQLKQLDAKGRGREQMLKEYYDVRVFGAVMSTGDNPLGTVRGAVQLNTFARSLAPIQTVDTTITRQAITKESEWEKRTSSSGKATEMGSIKSLAHGLYRGILVYNPFDGEANGVTAEDLDVLIDGLRKGYDVSRSAARGDVGVVKAILIEHEDRLGSTSLKEAERVVSARVRDEVQSPRSFEDYDIQISATAPPGVNVRSLW
jgi:CRISPR-associated protein Csd2